MPPQQRLKKAGESAVRDIRMHPFVAFFVVLALVFAATLGTMAAVGVWPGTVAFGVGVYRTDMAVDSTGAFHLVLLNASLVYATDRGGPWTTSVLDSGHSYFSASIARDSQDHLHIVGEAFINGLPYPDLGEIRYLTNAGGSWVATTIAPEGTAPSLTVDGSGVVRIAYLWSNETTTGNRTTDFHLVIVRQGTWTDTVVYSLPGDATADSETAIAAMANGRVAISFVGALYFAGLVTNAVVPWTFSWLAILPGSGGLYGPAPIAFDSSGNLHAAYTDYNTTTNATSIVHAVEAGGSWTREDVAQTGGPVTCSMVLDATDRVHLAYVDQASGVLSYVTNAGGGWVRQVVDGQAATYAGTSIGLLPGGGVAIAYEAVRGPPPGEFVPQSFVRIAGTNVAAWNVWDFFAKAAPFLTLELIVVAVGIRVATRARRPPAPPG